MDERQWLASDDPIRMLEWATDETLLHPHGWLSVSRRKLMLFADAAGPCDTCRRFCSDTERSPLACATYVAGAGCRSQRDKAALLRDIVGNPFRPVALPPATYRHFSGVDVLDPGRPSPWLNPDVLALAESAYDERVRPCPQFGYDPGEPHHLCARCQGRGTIDDGTLDPDRLAILSDALEEAGCVADEECRDCNGEGMIGGAVLRPMSAKYTHRRPCKRCGGTGRVPHPLLAHLRSPGPHYRGMWSLDLILGRE